MHSQRWMVGLCLVALLAVLTLGQAQSRAQSAGAAKTTGYALKKPVVGAACPTCPWGGMAEVVKTAMKFYGWDIQICYYCAGGPREARLVSKVSMATPPSKPSPDDLPTPKGPIDFGITGAEFLEWAYMGTNDFAKDPGTPQKQLRAIANIQEPTYLIVAVRADTGITNLSQIVEKKMPVKLVARTGIGGSITPAILDYYGITEDKIKSFGGIFGTEFERDQDQNVFIGFGSLVNAPEYQVWYQASQKYDLKYLEIAPDLRGKLKKQFNLEDGRIPLGLFRGVEKPIPTLTRMGTVIYGRTDMPDEFAYTLAKAMDEHQELLAWSHMNWSYNWRTVWKTFDVPLHPGAAKYYKEVGYMK
jgi:uncharacterized protein